MCGIVGIFNFSGKVNTQLQIAMRMAQSMKHRGPNDEGFVIFNQTEGVSQYYGQDTPFEVLEAYPELQSFDSSNQLRSSVALGHRRLSILDLSPGGHQPMASQDNRYWIVYNGEIYNYIELREELYDAGYHFKSESDTEVILAAYQHWGVDCLKKFNGDWAIIIYDSRNQELFVSRDRFGVKPLYYYQDDNQILFASEIKGLLEYPAVKAEPNLDWLKDYLESGPKEWKAETAFKNIFHFPFSHYALISLSIKKAWEPKQYWEIKQNATQEEFCDDKARFFASQYYDLLSDAVRLRLRADVKVASALSGGLDSSSIVYLVNQHLKSKNKQDLQETFSSVYKSPGTESCDESFFIDKLAMELGVISNQIEPLQKDVQYELWGVNYSMENPPESTCMSAWYTYKKTNERKIFVTLDGQGADEQLAGYVVYLTSHIASLPIKDLFRETYKLMLIPGARIYIFLGFVIRFTRFFFGDKITGNFIKRIKKSELPLSVDEYLKFSFQTSLVNLLHYADSASMAHSVESRLPFMDYRLVEFLRTLPSCYKIHDGWTKYIARLAFDAKLPNEICWRRDKMGWSIPETYWFRGDLRKWALDEIIGSSVLNKIGLNQTNGINIKMLIRKLNIAMIEKIFFKNLTDLKSSR
jgi:asparagine synthase (glutamine-hydrolysing)